VAAQPRYNRSQPTHERAAPVADRIVAADERHGPVESPAMALQVRLDAALTAGPWAGLAVDDRAERWPGAVRVAVLLGGAIGSWMLVWQLARLAF
jgi:hypothetical protein